MVGEEEQVIKALEADPTLFVALKRLLDSSDESLTNSQVKQAVCQALTAFVQREGKESGRYAIEKIMSTGCVRSLVRLIPRRPESLADAATLPILTILTSGTAAQAERVVLANALPAIFSKIRNRVWKGDTLLRILQTLHALCKQAYDRGTLQSFIEMLHELQIVYLLQFVLEASETTSADREAAAELMTRYISLGMLHISMPDGTGAHEDTILEALLDSSTGLPTSLRRLIVDYSRPCSLSCTGFLSQLGDFHRVLRDRSECTLFLLPNLPFAPRVAYIKGNLWACSRSCFQHTDTKRSRKYSWSCVRAG